jgi:hypothetical protein
MCKLLLAAAAAMALAAIPSAANATYTFDSVGDSVNLTFGGTAPNTAANLVMTLTGLDTANGIFTFSYTLTNISTGQNLSSRVSGFGFNDIGNLTLTSGAGSQTGASTNDPNGFHDIVFGKNISGGNNKMDICLTDNNCSGGASGGATLLNPSTGTFKLDYLGSLSSLTIDDITVRYQSTGANANGSGIGTVVSDNPPPAVPEPATWAMMLAGFGATGFAMRRARRKNLLAQIA